MLMNARPERAANGGRRQWGADKRTEPLSVMPPRIANRSLALGRLALVLTVVAWLAYMVTTIVAEFVTDGTQSMRFLGEAVTYVAIVSLLTFSAIAYLLARQGYLHRAALHQRTSKIEIDDAFDGPTPTITVLIPSYREETRVIRQTLLSAALQEFPGSRITLLIDDPPVPSNLEQANLLDAARALPRQVQELLAPPLVAARRAHDGFVAIDAATPIAPSDMRKLANTYDTAVAWLRQLGHDQPIVDHTDVFFVDHVIGRLADELGSIADAVRAAIDEGVVLPRQRMTQLYRSLVWIFECEVSSFERKRYHSLSDEPNKAMNLNSYIGLMGGSYDVVDGPAGRSLVPSTAAAADIDVPDTDFVLTLDADSVLLPEYCLRLVHLMQSPENERLAVAQTPYSAYPGSSTRLERLAGATTDIQHLLHQGMTYYDATFWVGANAVLRKRALDDIMEAEHDGTRVVRRYIQDRTPIEDTESSIDLVSKGWGLVNYPERLSYSATPPDFGALAIQRQRWANGGLLILPKMWNHARERRRRGQRRRLGELVLRMNYMASLFWSSLGLLLLLAYPYSERLLSPLVVIAALPYFVAMAGDLKACGYKRTDVFRMYGFNLLLLPVNLSGALRSLSQAVTGNKIAFARTPKVSNRTTTPISFVLFPIALIAFSVYTVIRDIGVGAHAHAAFATFNALACTWALVALIGLSNAVVDIFVNIREKLYKRERPQRYKRRRTPLSSIDAPPDWRDVLSHGAHASGGGRTSTADAHALWPSRPADVATGETSAAVLAAAIARMLDEERDGTELRVRIEHGDVTITLDGAAPSEAHPG